MKKKFLFERKSISDVYKRVDNNTRRSDLADRNGSCVTGHQQEIHLCLRINCHLSATEVSHQEEA